MIIKEPLKAPSKSLVLATASSKLPLLASPKFDGIRCIINDNGEPISRTFKLIPNKFIAASLKELNLPSDLDGELVTYTVTNGEERMDSYNDVQSKVMSQDGTPLFKYHVFDYVSHHSKLSYQMRYHAMLTVLAALPPEQSIVWPVNQQYCATIKEVEAYEQQCLAQGYEGIMLRNPLSYYKFGRATEREHIIYKLKRFIDGEATIIGMTELMHNDNKQEQDEFGRAKRSSHKDNQYGSGMMGALIVKDCISGIVFEIGTGFTERQRKYFWDNNLTANISKGDVVIKYKSQAHGAKDKPRCPVYLGFRNTSID